MTANALTNTILMSIPNTSKINSMDFPHQGHSVPTISERFVLEGQSSERVVERQMMSAQEVREFILQSSQRGLMIQQVLESMSQVMDQVQIQQLLLLLQAARMETAKVSDGAGPLEGEILAEEMAEDLLAEDDRKVLDS